MRRGPLKFPAGDDWRVSFDARLLLRLIAAAGNTVVVEVGGQSFFCQSDRPPESWDEFRGPFAGHRQAGRGNRASCSFAAMGRSKNALFDLRGRTTGADQVRRGQSNRVPESAADEMHLRR